MLTRPSKTMSAPDTNTDDVEQPSEHLSDTGHMTADGPGEFWCPACGCRCTLSPTDGTEYGHHLDCPERGLPDPRESYEWENHRLSPSVGPDAYGANRSTYLQNCLDAQDSDD